MLEALVVKEVRMARKNWDKIARQEFESMDSDAQHDWEDLRRITDRR